MELLSTVRMGVAQGLLAGVDIGGLNGLMVKIQPAMLMAGEGKESGEAKRDQLRASLLRTALEGLCVAGC